MAGDVFVHPSALNESVSVGAGTRIWAFAHVMEGATLGKQCNIGDHAFVESGAHVGNGVTVKNGVCIWEGITLEDYVFVGPNAVFTNDMYPRSPRNPAVSSKYDQKDWLVTTLVCEGASIGANATILCGTEVGRHALVAAGAMVIRDVPDHGIVVGNPARLVGFACVCGQTVGEAALVCAACERRYMRDGDGLRPEGTE